jgi:hypothetical protein
MWLLAHDLSGHSGAIFSPRQVIATLFCHAEWEDGCNRLNNTWGKDPAILDTLAAAYAETG